MVDLTFLKAFTKGDTAKMKRYISMYLQIAPQTLKRMHSDLKKEDSHSLAVNAHSLKPQADYMGVAELKEALMDLETEAKSGSGKDLVGLLEKVSELYEESGRELQLILDSL